jgi:hypothetical protein
MADVVRPDGLGRPPMTRCGGTKATWEGTTSTTIGMMWFIGRVFMGICFVRAPLF